MTCTKFSLNSRNRSASGTLPLNPHKNSASGPSWRTSVPQTLFICPPPCPISKYATGWTHVDGGPAPCGRPHRKLKLESRTSYCLLMQRSWRLFYQNFVFGQKKVDIFLRYKLVI